MVNIFKLSQEVTTFFNELKKFQAIFWIQPTTPERFQKTFRLHFSTSLTHT